MSYDQLQSFNDQLKQHKEAHERDRQRDNERLEHERAERQNLFGARYVGDPALGSRKDFVDRVKAQSPHLHTYEVAVNHDDGRKTIERQVDPDVAKAAERVRQAEVAYFQRYGHWPKEPEPAKENIWTADRLAFVEQYNLHRNSSKAEYDRAMLARDQQTARRELEQKGY